MLSPVFPPAAPDGLTVTFAIKTSAIGGADADADADADAVAEEMSLICPLITTCVMPLLFIWSC